MPNDTCSGHFESDVQASSMYTSDVDTATAVLAYDYCQMSWLVAAGFGGEWPPATAHAMATQSQNTTHSSKAWTRKTAHGDEHRILLCLLFCAPIVLICGMVCSETQKHPLHPVK